MAAAKLEALWNHPAGPKTSVGFGSKSKYMFGKVTIQLKLVDSDSARTVTAFYMSSDGPTHNEFDFEFLGNTYGEPYSVQTNMYVNGVGNREQRFNLWLDPTKDFHTYSIFWNQRQVVLAYLHEAIEPKVVHQDIKWSNILIDVKQKL